MAIVHFKNTEILVLPFTAKTFFIGKQ
jgi:hypothetical protein